jgi:hypothetical protein
MAQYTVARNDAEPSFAQVLLHRRFIVPVPASGIALNDNIEVHGFTPGLKARLHKISVATSATLGAGATLTPQINNSGTRTVIGSATTAGAASRPDSDTNLNLPFDLSGGEVLELQATGAGPSSAANAIVDIYVSPRISSATAQ